MALVIFMHEFKAIFEDILTDWLWIRNESDRAIFILQGIFVNADRIYLFFLRQFGPVKQVNNTECVSEGCNGVGGGGSCWKAFAMVWHGSVGFSSQK